ncbi:hypothetical protein Nepgr_010708 [Nepenthes gracilis]|uniref:Uncharacterized protein n=1 Tax=Nepenthes gracilis TaxID=150966 RepID=A0AAD3SCW4_NEPGR|nr:hypothetical protein Nepgr_010708 [Nepenthes gracilis]
MNVRRRRRLKAHGGAAWWRRLISEKRRCVGWESAMKNIYTAGGGVNEFLKFGSGASSGSNWLLWLILSATTAGTVPAKVATEGNGPLQKTV